VKQYFVLIKPLETGRQNKGESQETLLKSVFLLIAFGGKVGLPCVFTRGSYTLFFPVGIYFNLIFFS